jgi:hypothetical protein
MPFGRPIIKPNKNMDVTKEPAHMAAGRERSAGEKELRDCSYRESQLRPMLMSRTT